MSVRVHIYYENRMYDMLAEETTTLRNLLKKCEIPENTILFTRAPSEDYKTPLVNLEKTLKDYNMWFLEKSYVAEITVYNETDNYNKTLYRMYLEAAKEFE
jgi:hypothetical protein